MEQDPRDKLPAEPTPTAPITTIEDTSTISITTPEQKVQGAEDEKLVAEQTEANKVWFPEAVADSFLSGSNIAVQTVYDLQRMEASGPVDQKWREGGDSDKWISQQGKRIPDNQAWRFRATKNAQEAQLLLNDYELQIKEQEKLATRFSISPTSTFVAMGLAGLVDVDAPLAAFTGGLTSTAKIGINATKVGRLMAGAAAGGLVAGAAQTVGVVVDPTEDWTSIPAAGLLGMGFGAVGGLLTKAPDGSPVRLTEDAANDAIHATQNEFGETIAEGAPLSKRDIRDEAVVNDDPYGSDAAIREAEEAAAREIADEAPKAPDEAEPKRQPGSVSMDEVVEDTETEWEVGQNSKDRGSTMGAKGQPSTGAGIGSIRSTRTVDIIQNAQTRNTQIGVDTEWNSNYSNLDTVSDPIAKATRRFTDFLHASPLASDFARFMRSGSNVGIMLAYDLLENGSGIIRNNKSAAALMDMYTKDIMGQFMPYHDSYTQWLHQTKQASAWDRYTNADMRREFNVEVIKELNERNYGGGTRTKNQAVSEAADAMDAWSKREIEISKGRPGEGIRGGYDKITPKSGYFPQKWLGGSMQKLIDSGRFGANGKRAIQTAIKEAYVALHPQLTPKQAEIYAEAVVDRALRTHEGISTNMIGIFKDTDGRAAFEDLMRRNGESQATIDKIIDSLTSNKEEAGRPGHTKQRLDLDLRFVASNGVAIMDLVDTDINKLVAMRSRAAAGQSALARKGILSRVDQAEIKESILQEQAAKGQQAKTGNQIEDYIDNNKHLSAEDIDDLFSYFNGGPIAGGMRPMYSRIMKLTRLALLNGLGLTQMAELGPTIAAAGGVKPFFASLSKETMGHFKDVNSPLVQELKHMNILVPEEQMFRDDLTFEFEKPYVTHEYVQKFDNFLNKAQRLQGYTSVFYTVRNIQQRIVVTTMASKLAKHFKNSGNLPTTGKPIGTMSADRLRDLGIDYKNEARISKYFNDGTVQFDANGELVRLNLDKWDPEVKEEFVLSLNRSGNQLVQKALAGESSFIFHRDGVASLFFQLKSFPMVALEKQALRNARMADSEANATFWYGLLTAASVYTVRQTMNGNTDNLDPVKVAKGAFGMSNMTGWIPMWSDPLAGMLGMDELKFGGRYGANDVISIPPALTTLDRMAGIPGALLHAANPFQDMTNNDIRSLQTTPIIGNAYGMTLAANLMKEDIRTRPKEKTATDILKDTTDTWMSGGPVGIAQTAIGTINGIIN